MDLQEVLAKVVEHGEFGQHWRHESTQDAAGGSWSVVQAGPGLAGLK